VAGARVRLIKWAVIAFLIVFAVGGALFGPALLTDLTSRTGTFATVNRRYDRLRKILYWRSPEQKGLMRSLSGRPPGTTTADPSGPRIVTPRH